MDAGPTYLMNTPRGSPQASDAALMNQVNTLNTKLRVLEERFNNIRKKSQLTEHSMLNNQKKSATEFMSLHDEVKELRQHMREINEKLAKIIDELGRFAKKEELRILTTYITLWDMSRFLTKKEAQELVRPMQTFK